MTPHVRETEQTPIAVPTPLTSTALINEIKQARPAVEINAPAPELTEETGRSMLDKRRRRRARLSSRH
ncbi:MAG: hypothetical protein AAGA72_06885 [Pseudomonadota bacterium]